MDVIVRGKKQVASDGKKFASDTPFAALVQALKCEDYPESEPVIQWKGKDELAVVDVDFHEGGAPTNYHRIMLRVYPKPSVWWRSHGGGIKLVYRKYGGLTAEEMAALARYFLPEALCEHDIRLDKIELESFTRHPKYLRGDERCGDFVTWVDTIGELGRVRAILLGDQSEDPGIDEDAIERFLEEKGWERGQRLPHSECPIDPCETSGNHPVLIGDHGVTCFRCQGMGKGFLPWRCLIEGEPVRAPNPLRSAVRNRCHWEHARHVMRARDGAGEIDKLAYRALLRLWHVVPRLEEMASLEGPTLERAKARVAAEESLVKACFGDIPLVRGCRTWYKSTTLAPAPERGLDKILATLPAARYVEDNGRIRECKRTIGIFEGDYDLSERGYPAVIPLRGVDMAESVRPSDGTRIYALAPVPPELGPPFRRREREERERIGADERIAACFPGVNLDLVRLLVACKGIMQLGNVVEVPQVFVKGQSGSGKSMTARLAAQIACDKVLRIATPKDRDRFLQAYTKASETCAYALFDEFSKSGARDEQLRDYCLQFAVGNTGHKLYVGPTSIDLPAVVVITDPVVPTALEESEQTARRIAVVDLGAGANAGGRDWAQTCGTGTVERWRAGNPDAADAFLSDVMNRFPADTPFADVVRALGFRMLNDASETEDRTAEMRRFWELVAALPEHQPTPTSRWRGAGWRVFDWQENTDHANLYRDLTNNGENRQRLAEAKWGKITGVQSLTCQTSVPHGRQVGVRFDAG